MVIRTCLRVLVLGIGGFVAFGFFPNGLATESDRGVPGLLDTLDLTVTGALVTSEEAETSLATYERKFDNRAWWQQDIVGLSEEEAAKSKYSEATAALYDVLRSHRNSETALTAKLRIAEINSYPPSCRARCRRIAEEIARDFPGTWQAVLAEWLIGQILHMDTGWGLDPAGSRAAIRYHVDHLERYASLDISKNPHASSMFGQTSPVRTRPGSLRAKTLNIVACWLMDDLLDFAEAKRFWAMVVEEYPGSHEAISAASYLRLANDPTYRASVTRQYKAMHPEEAGKTK